MTGADHEPLKHDAVARLRGRSIVLVGLMGAGKTHVGKRLAALLDLPFVDTDQEIEEAARMTVAELFAAYGEPEFRALEARVVARLIDGPQHVIATGGGAFINEETRRILKERSVTIWLKADLDTLMERVSKRPTRPLLKTADPRATMKNLMDARYPIYRTADIHIHSRNAKRDTIAREIVQSLAGRSSHRKAAS
ncbi:MULTISPECIES: shikimate kinase [Aureimonas]|uniref:Shikimate kinase n=1 Tax=Aureimonas ureilytica TaxID=401562 RepID=A0A175R9G5_9HYPH|nr:MULTISPECIES: shikimate kinase [Aureimonas]KTQ95726.1 shikimate kinase [Aureimonas ureilytica]